MSTYDGPSLFEAMAKHSSALWVCVCDSHGIARIVPIYEPVPYRELVIRRHMVVNERHGCDGVWTYRASREEAEWRADLDLDQQRGAPCMKAYPKPWGVFAPRKRQTLEYSDILAMFGEAAA